MSAQPGAGGTGDGQPRDATASPGPQALRASDDDRDQVVALLRDQYSVGRLTLEEFQARTDAACAATTWGDLAGLLEDLPVRPPFLAAYPGTRPPGPRPVATWAEPAPVPDINIVLLIVLLIVFPPAGIIYLVIRLIQQSQSRSVITGDAGPGGAGTPSGLLPPPET